MAILTKVEFIGLPILKTVNLYWFYNSAKTLKACLSTRFFFEKQQTPKNEACMEGNAAEKRKQRSQKISKALSGIKRSPQEHKRKISYSLKGNIKEIKVHFSGDAKTLDLFLQEVNNSTTLSI